MKLEEIVKALDLSVKSGAENLDVDVAWGFATDMLSDVMGHAEEESLWITIQKHQNIVAVAVMKSLAAIILTGGREPDEDTLEKAEREGVVILGTEQESFNLVGKLYEMGIRGG